MADVHQQQQQQQQQQVTHASQHADSILRTHSVSSVRAVEASTRHDIERKKVELRELVGCRYRDLIAAADIILEMRLSSARVVAAVDTMSKLCDGIRPGLRSRAHSIDDVESSVSETTQSAFYSIASQMKLMVDTPEQVWSALENHHYLHAARLYLLSSHIFSNLRSTGRCGTVDLLTAFPVLPRQWAAISHFRAQILQGSIKTLSRVSLSHQELADALCAIVLLDDKSDSSSLMELFQRFLDARLSVIRSTLIDNHGSNDSDDSCAICNERICAVIRIIQATLLAIGPVFVGFTGIDSKALFPEVLETCSRLSNSPDPASCSSSGTPIVLELFGRNHDIGAVLKSLPPSVQNFRPVRSSICDKNTFPLNIVRQRCRSWLDDVTELVHRGTRELLANVRSVRELGDLTEAVWCELSHNDQEMSAHTSMSFEYFIGEPVLLWDALLRVEMLNRTRTITHSEFEFLSIGPMDMVDAALVDLETPAHFSDYDIGAYVLSESDAPAFVDDSVEGNLIGGGSAALGEATDPFDVPLCQRAHAVTSAIRGIVVEFDLNLAAIIADVSIMVHAITKVGGNTFTEECKSSPDNDNLDDANDLKTFVRDLCIGTLTEFSAALNERVKKLHVASQEMFTAADDTATNLYTSPITHEYKSCSRTSGRSVKGNDVVGSSFSFGRQLSHSEVKGPLPAAASCILVNRVLFLGRLARALAIQSRQIPEALRLSNGTSSRSAGLNGAPNADSTSVSSLLYRSRYLQSSLKTVTVTHEIDERLENIKCALNGVYESAHLTWAECVAAAAGKELRHYVLNADWLSLPGHENIWEKVLLSEESESGAHVESTLLVPAFPSVFVSTFLYRINEEISRACGHTADRSVLESLARILSDNWVLPLFEELVGETRDHDDVHVDTINSVDDKSHKRISQEGALQLIFDICLTTDILSGGQMCSAPTLSSLSSSSSSSSSFKSAQTVFVGTSVNPTYTRRVAGLVESLRGKVDPFDWEALQGYVDGRIKLCYQRNSVQFGHLISLNRLYMDTKRSVSVSRRNHNILPVTPTAKRFSLLPVTAPCRSVANLKGGIGSNGRLLLLSPSSFSPNSSFNGGKGASKINNTDSAFGSSALDFINDTTVGSSLRTLFWGGE